MRVRSFALCVYAVMASSVALAHGPQIQITEDDKKIVTRELHLDGPYSTALTSPKSVYVMPLGEFGGVWYSRPNGTFDPILAIPEYPSGPGLAYGYDLADGGTQAFAAGSVLSVELTDGLKRWTGTAFADAGVTQMKAYRGSNPAITSPPENFAITSDSGPFDSVALPAVSANYGAEGAEVHNSLRFALLGDGTSATSISPDGVYLLGMQIRSTQGLSPSDPYYFVLHKNVDMQQVISAVQSLGVAPGLVQWVVPEPAGLAIAAFAMFAASCVRGRSSD